MTREELCVQANDLLAKRIKLNRELKDSRIRHSATGKGTSWEWFTRTKKKIDDLFIEETRIRAEAAKLPKASQRYEDEKNRSTGSRYWSLCRIIEREFGKDTLVALIAQAEDFKSACSAAQIVEDAV